MRLTRRSFTAAALAAPLVVRQTSAQNGTTFSAREVGGKVLSLSPNGERIALLTPEAHVQIVDLATGEVLADAAESPATLAMDQYSITLKPDSSGLAFALRSFGLLIVGTIAGLNVGDDSLFSYTGDSLDSERIDLLEDFLTDTSPAFGADGLYFVRSGKTSGNGSTEIMRQREDGEIESIATVSPTEWGEVLGPMWVSENGEVSFQRFQATMQTSLHKALPGGEIVSAVDAKDGPEEPYELHQIGTNGNRFLVHDVRAYESWIGDSVANAWTRLEDYFPDGQFYQAVLHPMDDRLMAIEYDSGKLYCHENGEHSVKGQLMDWQSEGAPTRWHWAENTLVISGDTQAWILDTSEDAWV